MLKETRSFRADCLSSKYIVTIIVICILFQRALRTSQTWCWPCPWSLPLPWSWSFPWSCLVMAMAMVIAVVMAMVMHFPFTCLWIPLHFPFTCFFHILHIALYFCDDVCKYHRHLSIQWQTCQTNVLPTILENGCRWRFPMTQAEVWRDWETWKCGWWDSFEMDDACASGFCSYFGARNGGETWAWNT